MVLERAVAVDVDLVLVRGRATGGGEECPHALEAVRDAGSTLGRRATAEVDESVRHRCGTTGRARAIENEDVGAGSGRLVRRARTRRAEADDDNVSRRAPRLDLGC